MKKYDVAVVGAGTAGCVAALMLARAGRKVVIVDRAKYPARRLGESLPAAARPLLRHLGLLPLVDLGPHTRSFGNHSAWGSNQIYSADFIADPNGLGWHLNRVRFDDDLREFTRQAGVEFINKNFEDLKLDLDFTIDATGRGSHIARRLGATRTPDDKLTAVYAWLDPKLTDEEEDTRTFIESSPTGWWYTSRLPDRSRVVVFHTDAENAHVLARAGQKWLSQLQQTSYIRDFVADAQWLTGLHMSEACGARLDHFAGANWLATGDAALSFDPLSSQGMFNALYTGMKAGQAAHAHLSGEGAALAGYTERLESIRASYLKNHQAFYRAEKRWRDQSFWRQRFLAS